MIATNQQNRLSPRDYNARGVSLFYQGEIQRAAECFIDGMELEFDHYTYTNLAFLCSFYAQPELLEQLLDRLKRLDKPRIETIKLQYSVHLALGKSEAVVFDNFVNKYITGNIIRRAAKPVLFFHIPKCGGTTLNKYLLSQYYSLEKEFFAGYTELHLLKFCLRCASDYFPYLSSQHMELSQLGIDDQQFHKVAILRDPVDRIRSAFRQTLSSNNSGRSSQVLPKYGGFWDYLQCQSLSDWLRLSPENELNKQLATFSQNMSVTEAKKKLENIETLVFLEQSNCFKRITEALKIPYQTEAFSTKHNASSKAHSIDNAESEKTASLLEREITLIDSIKQSTSFKR